MDDELKAYEASLSDARREEIKLQARAIAIRALEQECNRRGLKLDDAFSLKELEETRGVELPPDYVLPTAEEPPTTKMAGFQPLEVYIPPPPMHWCCPRCGGELVQTQVAARSSGGLIFLFMLGMGLAIFIVGIFIMILSAIIWIARMSMTRTEWRCSKCWLLCSVPGA